MKAASQFPGSSVGKESTCNGGDPSSIHGSERFAGERIGYTLQYSWASLMAQLVKNPTAVQETWVQPLGGKVSWRSSSIYSFQHSGLENFMDCVVYGVTKNQTQLSNFHLYSMAYQLKAFVIFLKFYWSIVDLQCSASLGCRAK